MSDPHYLIGMKTPLIVSGCLKPGQEFVFPPVDGTKGVKAVASIVGGRNEELRVALFDHEEDPDLSLANCYFGLCLSKMSSGANAFENA
jgi:hypothetical protein